MTGGRDHPDRPRPRRRDRTATPCSRCRPPDGSEAYTRRGDLPVSADRRAAQRRRLPGARRRRPDHRAAGGTRSDRRRRRDPGLPTGRARPAAAARSTGSSWSRCRARTIAKGLDGLFRVDGRRRAAAPTTRQRRDRQPRKSNVNTTEALVDMIEAQRARATCAASSSPPPATSTTAAPPI